MSLIAWFPLNSNLNNQGTVSFDCLGTAVYTSGNGKVTKNALNCSSTVTITNLNISTLEYSMTVWVYIDTTISVDCHKFISYNYTTDSAIEDIYVTDSGTRIKHDRLELNCSNVSKGWHQLTYISKNSRVTAYLDGNFMNSAVYNINSKIKNITLGAGTDKLAINDFRVYDHALSTKEIKELAQGLCLHYNFNFENLYQPIEYIESTGTQYINTEISYTLGHTYKLTSTALYTITTPNNQIIGFGGNAGNGIGTYKSTFWECDSSICLANTKYNMEWCRTPNSWNRIINGVSYYGTGDVDSKLANTTLKLFACTGHVSTTEIMYYCYMRLYSCKIYDNDVLVRDYIPVIRKADGKPGLFDLIENKFYINQGDGEFLVPINIIHQIWHNPISDVRTYFDFTIQKWNSTTCQGIIKQLNISAENTFSYLISPTDMDANTTRLRFKHNGEKSDIDIYNNYAINPTKYYYISFYCTKADPTKINGIEIKNFVFYEFDNSISDNSGYKNSGTFSSSITTSSNTPIGNVSGHLNNVWCINNTAPKNMYAMSVFMWLKQPIPDTQIFLFGTFDSWTNNGIGWWADEGSQTLSNLIRVAEATTYTFGSAIMNACDESWHLIGITFDGSNYKTYKDGVLLGTVTTTSGHIYNPVYIFGGAYFNNEKMSGYIADVKLFATALSEADIKELYLNRANIDDAGNAYCNCLSETELSNKFSLVNTGIFNIPTILESEYQPVEYIESTGNQYLDTNFIPNSITTIETKVAATSNYVFGCGRDEGYGGNAFIGSFCNGSGLNLEYGAEHYGYISSTPDGINIIKTYIQNNKYYVNNNGTIHNYSITTHTTNGHFLIGAVANSTAQTPAHAGNAKYYYLKLFNDNWLIHDYIPVIRKIDNKPGLLDQITNTFYPSNTGIDFIAGPTINTTANINNTYTILDYIESTGTQWIDTGYSNSEGFAADLKFMLTSVPSETNGYIIGCHNLSDPYGRNGFQPYYGQWQLGHGDNYPMGGTPLANTLYYGDVDTKKGSAYLKINGETVVTDTGSTTLSSSNVLIFTDQYILTYQGLTLPAKVYSCKIYTPGKTQLVRDFIPVKRNTDNEIGLLDLVKYKFYKNAGTGKFLTNQAIFDIDKLNNNYTVLEYIESTGGKWIDTELAPGNKFSVELDVLMTTIENNPILQIYTADGGNSFGIYAYNGKWHNGLTDSQDGSAVANTKYHFIYECANKKQKLYANNILQYETEAEYSELNPPKLTWHLCGYNWIGVHHTYGDVYKLYSAKFYNENNNLIRNFIPVKQKSTDKIGLLDLIENKFYENKGDGEFVVGPEIEIKTVTNFIPNNAYENI